MDSFFFAKLIIEQIANRKNGAIFQLFLFLCIWGEVFYILEKRTLFGKKNFFLVIILYIFTRFKASEKSEALNKILHAAYDRF